MAIINGTNGDDILNGTSVADTIYAGGGIDTVHGGGGNDIIYGGGGVIDFLYGDAGNDTFFIGAGDAFLWGGAGNDRYAIQQSDMVPLGTNHVGRIMDLQVGDKIDFSAIDANPNVAGNQAFQYVYGPPTGNVWGKMFLTLGAGSLWTATVYADNKAMAVIIDHPNHTPAPADFIL